MTYEEDDNDVIHFIKGTIGYAEENKFALSTSLESFPTHRWVSFQSLAHSWHAYRHSKLLHKVRRSLNPIDCSSSMAV